MPIVLPDRRRRLPLAALTTLTLATGLLLLVQPVPSAAQAPSSVSKPAKKDSILRTKPKDATLTASATPAQARPGEIVTYRVTAKLSPNWHIYTYAKAQQGDGPRNTKFDFFDTAGFAPDGEWTASKAPISKKEPAFPDLTAVESFDDEVTWSLRLKAPTDAEPGPHTLRCQASYQICDASRCSFPGQWALPDVVVTIVGTGNEANKADAPKVVAVANVAPAEAPKPKKKDSPERIKPKSVALTASIAPAQAKPGDTVQYKVTAKLDPEWHIYDYAKDQPQEGPRNTQFDFFDTDGLTPAGDWKSDASPLVKEEPAFDNLVVSYYEDHVTWSLPLKVPADAAPGERTLRCQIAFQICDPRSCAPPGQWTLPDVVFNVVKGDTPVAAAVTKTDTPPANPVAAVVAPKAESAAGGSNIPVEAIAPKRTKSEVEQKAQQGIIPLMIASALGGLLALVMPCVWPMVPITVNFFVKQGQKNQGSTTGLAITYCLAIIGVFTTVGVLCSFFLSAAALPRLANSPWINFFVAGLFLMFGLSLLGMFEIRLPNSLLNASAKGESRGGLVGVMFMAMTLTITSFTCTFPVVGGLLVMASAGQFFYPIVGLATFSTVLALPFFLLALSPGMLSKVPKSGDWMNAVKVVGGLVEIGAAFKFLNTAEIAFVTSDNAWIDAQFVLTAWVVLAAVCGFYLLGFFRTDHDLEEVKVGPGRMVAGIAFLGIALFLAPALFGRPPQSQIWERMVMPMLPPDASELQGSPALYAQGGDVSGQGGGEVKASDKDPAKAERQEKRFHGVIWGLSLDEAKERAKSEGKGILIDFTGVNCANCRLMEQKVLPRAEVTKLLGKFVTVQLFTDYVQISSITADQREELARKNQERQIDMVQEATNPFYVVITPEGEVIGTKGGYSEPEVFVDFLNDALTKLKGAGKMARVDLAR